MLQHSSTTASSDYRTRYTSTVFIGGAHMDCVLYYGSFMVVHVMC
jgi:hypothetical protein